MKLKTIILIAFIVFITIISMQNTQNIVVNLLYWDAEISLILLIYIVCIVSFLIGIIAPNIWKKKI